MRLVCLLCCVIFSPGLYSQQTLAYNRGFELTSIADRLWAFTDNGKKCVAAYDSRTKRNGKHSLRLQSSETSMSTELDAPFFSIDIPGSYAKGKKTVKLTGWVKVTPGTKHAALWLSQYISGVTAEGMPFASTAIDTAKQNAGWQYLEVNQPVGNDVMNVSFGGLINGGGQAWFDDLTLYIDGVALADIAKPAPEPTHAEVAWINRNAVPILPQSHSGSDPGLDSLSKWIGNATVVAVGEPTHGTSEAALFKFRFFQYLVEHRGFTTFVVEGNLPECSLINDYVLNGKDSAKRLLGYMARIGRNKESLQFFEWMHQYNQSHAAKIQFRGIDMQSIRVAIPVLDRLAPLLDSTFKQTAERLSQLQKRLDTTKDLAQKDVLKTEGRMLAENLKERLADLAADYHKRLPGDTVKYLLQVAAVLNQYFAAPPNGIVFRDSCMASNLVEIFELYPSEKLFFSAHNYHIAKQENTMGKWLQTHLGSNYFPIAIATATGSYSASKDTSKSLFGTYPLQVPYAGTAEYYLSKAKISDFALSLQKNSIQTQAAWLGREVLFRSVGYLLSQEQFAGSRIRLREQYDAVIFFKHTTSTQFILNQ